MNIDIGKRFEATTKLGDKENYEIVMLDPLEPSPYNIKLKRGDGHMIYVEPEWFNQRKIKEVRK